MTATSADWATALDLCGATAAKLLRAGDRAAGIDRDDVAGDAVVRLLTGSTLDLSAAAVGRAVAAELERARRRAAKVAPSSDLGSLIDGGERERDAESEGEAAGIGAATVGGEVVGFWGWDTSAKGGKRGGYTDTGQASRLLSERATARRLMRRAMRSDVVGVAESSRWAMRPASDVRDHLHRVEGLRAATDGGAVPVISGADGCGALWADLLDGGAASLGLGEGVRDAGTVLLAALRDAERFERTVYAVDADGKPERDRLGRRVVVHHRGDVRRPAGVVWSVLYRFAELARGEALSKWERATLRRMVGQWARERSTVVRCVAPVVLDPSTESAAALAATAGEAAALAERYAAVVPEDRAHRVRLAYVAGALARQAVGLLDGAERAAVLAGVVPADVLVGEVTACGCVRCAEVPAIRDHGERERANLARRCAVRRAFVAGRFRGEVPAALAGPLSLAWDGWQARAWAALRRQSARRDGRHGLTGAALVPGSWQWQVAALAGGATPGAVAAACGLLRLTGRHRATWEAAAATVAGREAHALARAASGATWDLGAVLAGERDARRALGKLRRDVAGQAADFLDGEGVGGGSLGWVLVPPAATVEHLGTGAGAGCGCRVCWGERVATAGALWRVAGASADRAAAAAWPGGVVRGGPRLVLVGMRNLLGVMGQALGTGPGWQDTGRPVDLAAARARRASTGAGRASTGAAVTAAAVRPVAAIPSTGDVRDRAAALLDRLAAAGG